MSVEDFISMLDNIVNFSVKKRDYLLAKMVGSDQSADPLKSLVPISCINNSNFISSAKVAMLNCMTGRVELNQAQQDLLNNNVALHAKALDFLKSRSGRIGLW